MTRRIKSDKKRRSPADYSKEQIKFIADKYPKMTVVEVLEEFNKAFPDNQITKWQLYRLNYKYNFKEKRLVKCRNCPVWSDEIIEFCRQNATKYSYREMAEVLTKKFKKPFIEEQITSMYSRKGITNGKHTAFYKGHTPHNKGKKWDEYLSKEQQERQKKNWYKKGNRPYSWQPVGTMTIRKDKHFSHCGNQYRWIKYQDNHGSDNYMLYSRYVYENYYNVKLKTDDLIVHLDGNSLNDSVENLFLVSNKENATLNKCYRNIYDPELKKASILAVRLKQKTKELDNE